MNDKRSASFPHPCELQPLHANTFRSLPVRMWRKEWPQPHHTDRLRVRAAGEEGGGSDPEAAPGAELQPGRCSCSRVSRCSAGLKGQACPQPGPGRGRSCCPVGDAVLGRGAD